MRAMIFIICCISSFWVKAEPEVAYPSDWGQISKKYMQGVECPSLEGKYANLGWSYTLSDGKEAAPSGAAPFLALGERDRLKKINANPEDYKDGFVIRQENIEQLRMIRLNKNEWEAVANSEAPVLEEFITKAKDGLRCNNGWWELPGKSFSGDNEGSPISFSFRRRFTRLENNDLIVHSHDTTKRTDLFIFSNTTVWDHFSKYRFKPQ
jgi:hypothetical protein